MAEPEYTDQDTQALDNAVRTAMSGTTSLTTPDPLRARFASAVSVNPDQYAEARKVARATGVPVDTAMAHPEELTRRQRVESFDTDTYRKMFPASAQFLERPENTKIAHDDTDNLGQVETALKAVDTSFKSAFMRGVEDPIQRIGTTLKVLGYDETGKSLENVKITDRDYQSASGAFLDAPDYEFSILGFAPQYLPRAVAEQAGQVAGSIATRAVGATVGGAAGSLAGPGGTIGGAAAGAFGGPFVFEAMQIAGPVAVERAKNNGRGKPNKEDLAFAFLTAGASGSLNALGARYLPGGEKAVGGFARRLAEAIYGEGGTEAFQALVQQAGETAGTKAGLDLSVRGAVGEGIIGGAAGGSAVGVEEAAGRAYDRIAGTQRMAERAEQHAKMMEELRNASAASKVLQRDPEAFQQFLATAAENNEAKDVYMDSRSFAQSGIDPAELAKISPSVAEQLPAALQVGGDVRIPISEFGLLMQSPFADKLIENARLEPDGMSRVEAQEFMQSSAAKFEEELGKLTEQQQLDDTFGASRDAVREDILRQLRETGRFTDDVNNPYAALVAAMFSVMAARTGTTPEELYKRSGLGIRAEQIGEVQLEQTPRYQGPLPVDDTGNVRLFHWTTKKNLKKSDPSKWGKGGVFLPTSERNRIGSAPGRTYFGIAPGQEFGYTPEPGLGDAIYSADVPADRLYDADSDPLGLRAKVKEILKSRNQAADSGSEFENLVKQSGYLGYWSTNPQLGAVAAVFDSVPLKREKGDPNVRRIERMAGVDTTQAGEVRDRGGVPGGPRLLDVQSGAYPGDDRPLEGGPRYVDIEGRGRVENTPFTPARRAAAAYMASRGLVYDPPTKHAKLDTDRAERLADEFDRMEHNPNDPIVKAAYDAMIQETLAQYQFVKATGLKIEFIRQGMEDPYASNPRLATLDVKENNHLWVFPTDSGFGSNPKFDPTQNPLFNYTNEFIGKRRLRANDVFRIVHDYFGHVKDGNGFRAEGEENAWQSHAAMFTPLARRALTTETRGQNSWVNFGPEGERNRTAKAGDTTYADQKIGLLPEWASEEGFLGGAESGTQGEFYQSENSPRIYGLPGFYSKMYQYMAAKLNGTGTATQYKQQIQAALKKGEFKQDEYLWSNMDTFFESLDPTEKISKNDVLKWVENSSVTISEKIYSKTQERVKVFLKKGVSEAGFDRSAFPTTDDLDFSGAEPVEPTDEAVEHELEYFIDNHKSDNEPEDWFKAGNSGDLVTVDDEDDPTTFEWDEDNLRTWFNDEAYQSAYNNSGYEFEIDHEGYTYSVYFEPDGGYATIRRKNPDGTVTELREPEGRINEENLQSHIIDDMYDIGILFTEDDINDKEDAYNEELARKEEELANEEASSDTVNISESEAVELLMSGDKGVRIVSDFENFRFHTEFDIPYMQEVLRQGSFAPRRIVPFTQTGAPLEADFDTTLAAVRKGYKVGIRAVENLRAPDDTRNMDKGETALLDLADVEKGYGRRTIEAGRAHYIVYPKKAEVEGIDFTYQERWTGSLNWERYQEGGPKKGQHELVIQLPDIKDKGVRQHNWKDAKNVLLHTRFNERYDAEGKRTLFIEEIQSDWHQQGSERGYRGASTRSVEELIKATDEVTNELRARGASYAPTEADWAANPDLELRFAELSEELKRARANIAGVPEAPFAGLNKYNELAMKRLIAFAATNGFERVSWTTGEQQAQRWSGILQREISRITVVGRDDNNYHVAVYTPGGGNVSDFLAQNVKGAVLVAGDEKPRGDIEAFSEGTPAHVIIPKTEVTSLFGKSISDSIDSTPDGDALTGQNLKINSKGMLEVYNKVLVNVANGLIKKFGGKVATTKIDTGGDKPTEQWAFDITDDLRKSVTESGFALFQKNRGSFNPDTSTITLLQNADLSTFLHETGHFFLETLNTLALSADAPQDIKDDMASALKWMGVADLDTWNAMTLEQQRPFHEKFARGFEAYLFEGKSPNLEMRQLFQRFRAWLLNVYRELRNLNVELDPEIRGVFDRMLATTQQIKEAEAARSFEPLFTSPEDANMTAEEYKAYHELSVQATQDAISDLETRTLRDMKWMSNARDRVIKKLQREAAAKRKAMRQEVTKEVMSEPVNRARQFLRRGLIDGKPVEGPHRLSIIGLRSLYDDRPADPDAPTPPWQQLQSKYGKYGYIGEEGLHPDTVAEMFGYTSGDELVMDLVNAEDPRDKISGLTDQRMLERYGDLTDQSSIERAADAAIHNEARTKMVGAEMQALQKAAGQGRIAIQAAKEYANRLVSRLHIRDVKPARYVAAEGKAARASAAARKKGDIPLAALEKRNQLVHHYSAKMAFDAQEDIEKAVAYLQKFSKDGTRKNIDTDYLDQIDALLERFDLRQGVSLKAIEKRKSLVDWVEKQRELGLEPDITPAMLNEANRKHYKDMTVEEMRGLRDTVRQIEHLGRLKEKLLTAQDQRNFDMAKDAIVASVLENGPDKVVDLRTRANAGGGLGEMGRKFLALHRKMASLARELDGFKDGGPVWEYFIRAMNTAGDKETTMREQATMKLHKLVRPILSGGRMGGRGAHFPTIGMSLNREERIAIALNTGNLGNLQRLLDGEGWTLDQVRPVLDSLSKADWDFVQSIWDYFETFRPAIGAKEKRVYGKEPAWVDPHPVETKYGSYRGGYYPIRYDTSRSGIAGQHADAEEAKAMLRGAYTSATTRRSFTKARAEEVKGRPLLYSFAGIYQGVTEIIHDLSWHEWLIDTNRLLRNQSIDRAIRNKYGAEAISIFKTAILDIARGETPALNVFERGLNHLRVGATIAGLGWNITTSLLQPIGLTNSMVRIGPGWVAKGITSWLKSPVDTVDQVYEKSEFMRIRGKTMQREINEIQNLVSGASLEKSYKLTEKKTVSVPTLTGGLAKIIGVDKALTARSWAQISLFLTIQKMQLVADIPTWLGQYEKSIAAGDAEAKAVALADQAVLDSQGGGQVKDLSGIQRGGALQRLFTNFYSYFNVVHNLGAEVTKKTDFKNPMQAALAARDYLLLFTVPVVLATLLKEALTGDGEDDDDELAKKLAAEQISYLFGTLVGLREATLGAQKVLGVNQFKTSYSGPAGLRFLQETDKLATQISQGEVDDAFRRSAINTTGILFHLPSGQINKTWDGTQAFAEGETDNPMAIIAGAPR